MRHVYTRLVSAAFISFGLAVALASPARGQNVTQPPWRGHLALASRGHPGLASVGYGVARVSPAGQGDSRHGPLRLGTDDTLATEEQGQDALATAGVPHEPASLSGGPLQPVTVEHRGRLLVLTYGSKPGAGGLMSSTDPRGESPRFVVYQGRRQIASGQFEYG